MARFRDVPKPVAKRRPVEFQLHDGSTVKTAVRSLSSEDDDQIDTKALAYAKARDVESPKAGDPIYDRGIIVHSLLLACSDPDSPDHAPVPYFESIDEIEKGLDRDRLAYLYTTQQVWQDEQSGRVRRLQPHELYGKACEIAGSLDERPFLEMSPGLQWSVMRAFAEFVVSNMSEA